MLKKVNKTSIIQKCSNCFTQWYIQIDTLLAGVEGDPNIIMLPKCSCGAQEFLNRSLDNPGSHAKLVNRLYKKLDELGRCT